MKGLRIILDNTSSQEFRLMLDDEDITEKVHVHSLQMHCTADSPRLAHLEVYVDGVEFLADHTMVTIVPYPRLQRLRINLINLYLRTRLLIGL